MLIDACNLVVCRMHVFRVKTKAQMQPWIVYTCGPMG